MLAAADTGGEGPAESSGEVGRVLADALAEGGNDTAVGALLDTATAQGPAGHLAEALASDGPAAVPAWDTAEFAGSPEFARVMMVTEHGLHPDAVPSAA
jgi:hypothetical protein